MVFLYKVNFFAFYCKPWAIKFKLVFEGCFVMESWVVSVHYSCTHKEYSSCSMLVYAFLISAACVTSFNYPRN
jgi:hypothetical protein